MTSIAQKGLTLLELLVALFLLSLLMAGLTGVLRQSDTILTRNLALTDTIEQKTALARLFKDQIAQARPLIREGAPPALISGTASEILFASTRPVQALPAGDYIQTWALVPELNGIYLKIRFESSALPDGPVERVISLPGTDARFAFLDQESGGEPEWLDAWTDARLAPLLVRLQVQGPGGEDFYATPRLLLGRREQS